MYWKINYLYDGKKDCLFYGGKITEEDKQSKINKLKESGFKILSVYKVKKM